MSEGSWLLVLGIVIVMYHDDDAPAPLHAGAFEMQRTSLRRAAHRRRGSSTEVTMRNPSSSSRRILLVCTAVAIGLAATAGPIAAGEGAVRSWTEEGWLVSGGGRDVYAVRSDPTVRRDREPTLLLEPIAETNGLYGTWMRVLDASPYRGKRVRIVGFTRVEDAGRRADFWARVQGSDSPADGRGIGGGGSFDIRTDADWERHEFVFAVPDEAATLQYGVGLAGPGRAWCDDISLEVLDD